MSVAVAVESYWRAVESADRDGAQKVVRILREEGVSLPDVLAGVVMPTQARVGELWAANEWTVAQEHSATAVSEFVVRQLAQTAPAPAPDAPKVLVGCIEQEWHALPALVVAECLRDWGCAVSFVGANATTAALVGHIVDVGPRVVMLSASLSASLPRVRRHVEAVRATGTPVMLGGRAFDPAGLRAERLGATAYALSPREAFDLIDTLPQYVEPALPVRSPGVVEALTIQADGALIGSDVTRSTNAALGLGGGGERTSSPNDWRVILATHVPHLTGCLAGALMVDDPTVMTEAREWLQIVLDTRGAPPEAAAVLWRHFGLRLRELPHATRMLKAV